MNLLIDQDDQQNAQQYDELPQTPDAELLQPEEEGPIIPPDTPEEVFRYEPAYTKKRSVLGPIVVIAVLLIIIAVAAYFSFFYKATDFMGYTPAEQREKVTPDSVISQAPVAAATTLPKVDTSEKIATQPTEAPEPTRTLARMENAIIEASRILSEIIMQHASDVNIGTVIIDESSFSVEISSPSRSAIEAYFAGLKAKLNSELSFYPSSGNYSGVRALITGTFPAINKYASPSKGSVDIGRTKQILGEKARESGLKVIELSSEKARMINGIWQTPLFIKIVGKMDQFQAFCERVGDEVENVAVSKIIVIFSTKQTATFVLRLEALKAQ